MRETAAPTQVRDAVRVFADKGFDAATVEDLAAASGISRATFFRRYRTKTDVVFADHDALLERVEELLSRTPGDGYAAIADAAELVLSTLLADPDTARARYELVRTVPILREREILTTRRYEALFVRHLRSADPAGDPDLAVGFAAAAVAVHNAAHREWLAGDGTVTPAQLRQRILHLARGFRAATQPDQRDERVIVLRVDGAASRGEVLRQVSALLD